MFSQEFVQIERGDIHLWLLFYETLHDAELIDIYREILTADEISRESRFYFERDRRCFLISRAMVRVVLSRYATIRPEHWCFSTNKYGRPQVANKDPAVAGLTFNLAHTDGLITLAVAKWREVGVDAENILTRAAPLSIANSCFSIMESAALNALPSGQQSARFFEYWTLKESYVKAEGSGLSIALDQVVFDLTKPGSVTVSFGPQLPECPARWEFWLLQPSSEFLVAICAEKSVHRNLQLSTWMTIPYKIDVPIECRVLRNSEAAVSMNP